MITSRQKTRLDDAAPVLFRLPNLRTLGSSPNKSTNKSASVSAEAAGEKSSGVSNPYYPQAAPISEATAPSATAANVGPPSPSRFDHLLTPPADSNASVADRAAQAVASEPKHEEAPSRRDFYSVPGPMGRSWMERVGSRMILVVTLLVIVSAAWITGQRMPGAKPTMTGDNLVQTADPANDKPTSDRLAVSEQTETNSPSNAAPLLAGPLDTAQNDAAQTDEAADSLELLEPNRTVEMLSASQPSSSVSPKPSNTTTLLPPSENSSSQVSPNETLLGDTSEMGSMVSLEAPLSSVNAPSHQASQPSLEVTSLTAGNASVPAPSGEEAFYTAEDSSQSLQNYPAQTVSLQTRTPNAPTIDPNVLVPWADENSPSRSHQFSATPNPITDWSKYLPGVPVETNVRTTSAVQTPDGATVQQAGYPQSQPAK